MVNELTQHASCRLRQRGFREDDVDMILEHGTPTHDGIILTSKDVAEQVADLKRKMTALERLQGAAVFLEGNRVVTVYRPSLSKIRRMIRDGRGRRRRRP